jgi:hypothetical protein
MITSESVTMAASCIINHASRQLKHWLLATYLCMSCTMPQTYVLNQRRPKLNHYNQLRDKLMNFSRIPQKQKKDIQQRYVRR